MRLVPQLSAASAIIKFNGVDSGWVSSLRFSQNFNLRPVKHLRTHQTQGFVKGISDVSVSATQGFIELGTIFGSLVDIASLYDDVKNLNSSDIQTKAASAAKLATSINDMLGNPLGKVVDSVLDNTGAIGTAAKDFFGLSKEPVAKSRQKVKEYLYQGGPNNMMEIFSELYFDIEIISPVEKTFNMIPFKQTPIWVLKDCKINVQSATLSSDAVIVMRDLQIVARDVQEKYVESEVFKTF